MKGRPLGAATCGLGKFRVKSPKASMKGRPLRGGDRRDGRPSAQLLPASMKGRPLRGGDLAVPKYTPATVFRPR